MTEDFQLAKMFGWNSIKNDYINESWLLYFINKMLLLFEIDINKLYYFNIIIDNM